MSANGVNVDQEQRKEIAAEVNNQVLRRIDPAFRRVMLSAAHVAIYRLNKTKQWERCDVEGAMFVYERAPPSMPAPSQYRIICINRRNPKNFSENLERGDTSDIEILQEKMVSFGMNGALYGVWFYVAEEVKHFYEALFAIRMGKVLAPASYTQPSTGNKDTNNKDVVKNFIRQDRKNKKNSPNRKARAVANPSTQSVGNPNVSQSSGVKSDSTGMSKDNPLQRFFPDLKTTANGILGPAMPKNAQDPTIAEKNARVVANAHPKGNALYGTDANINPSRPLLPKLGMAGASPPLNSTPPAPVAQGHGDATNKESGQTVQPPGITLQSSPVSQQGSGNRVSQPMQSHPHTMSQEGRAVFMDLLRRGTPQESPPTVHPMAPMAHLHAVASSPMAMAMSTQMGRVPNSMGHLPAQMLPVHNAMSPMGTPVPVVPTMGNSMPQIHGMPMGLPAGMVPAMHPGMHPAHYQAVHAQQQAQQHAQQHAQHAQQQAQHAHMAFYAHQHGQHHAHMHHPHNAYHRRFSQDARMPSVGPVGQTFGGAHAGFNPQAVPQVSNGPRPGDAAPVQGNGVHNSNAGEAILGMIQNGPQTSGSAAGQAKPSKPEDTAHLIAASITTMNLQGGNSGTEALKPVLDKAGYRAVIQRMLTDRKLFDSSYDRYVALTMTPRNP